MAKPECIPNKAPEPAPLLLLITLVIAEHMLQEELELERQSTGSLIISCRKKKKKNNMPRTNRVRRIVDMLPC